MIWLTKNKFNYHRDSKKNIVPCEGSSSSVPVIIKMYDDYQVNIMIQSSWFTKLDTEYVILGIEDDMLIIKSDTQAQGYKLTVPESSPHLRRIRSTRKELKKFIGGYNYVYWDMYNGWYVITKNDLIKEEK